MDGKAVLRLPSAFTAEAFSEPACAAIYAEVVDQVTSGFEVDVALIAESLRGSESVRALGGRTFLADLMDKAPPTNRLLDFARALLKLAGRRAVLRVAEELRAMAEDDARPGDASSIIAAAEEALIKAVPRDGRHDPVSIGDAAAGQMASTMDAAEPVGVSTGLPSLDKRLGPIARDELIVLGGATGMGKSLLGVAIGQNVAAPWLAAEMNGLETNERPRGVIFFHGEMSFGGPGIGGQAIRRHLADVGFHFYGESFPTFGAIKRKAVSPEQLEMMERVTDRLRGMPIVGVKRPGLTLQGMRSIALRQIDAFERAGVSPGLIVMDHVGLMEVPGAKSIFEAQTRIAIGLKILADELKVAILALSQLSRTSQKQDDKRPTLNDLKNSGEWENSADAVLLAYRDAYYAEREAQPKDSDILAWSEWDRRRKSKELEILMGKVREGGGGGSVKLWVDVAYNAVRTAEPSMVGGFL